MGTYLYRCTEQQLEEHLSRIAEAGDKVEHVIYKGGRDYVLVVRKDDTEEIVRTFRLAQDQANRLMAELEKRIENGVYNGSKRIKR